MEGLDVVTGLRGWSNAPIVVVSGRDAEGDKIAALGAGADDSLTKPFGMGELVARLRAVLRRCRSARAEQPIVATGHFVIDPRLAAGRHCLVDRPIGRRGLSNKETNVAKRSDTRNGT
jgi:DNA-binding response OmpR family regulator